jgi:hypothetical protein
VGKDLGRISNDWCSNNEKEREEEVWKEKSGNYVPRDLQLRRRTMS